MSTVPSSRPSQNRNQPPAERLPRAGGDRATRHRAAGVGYLSAGISPPSSPRARWRALCTGSSRNTGSILVRSYPRSVDVGYADRPGFS